MLSLFLYISAVSSTTIYIKPGDNIQSAINQAQSNKGGSIIFNEGTYTIDKSLMMYSDITLQGNSNGSRPIIQMDPNNLQINEPLITNNNEKIENVEIINLELKGNIQPSEQHYPACCKSSPSNCTSSCKMRDAQFCIIMTGDGSDINSAVNSNLLLKDLTVTTCAMGIHLKGWKDVIIDNLDLYLNGMIQEYFHNMYLRRDFNVTITNLYSHDSPTGCGINISQSDYIYAFLSLFTNNYWRGLRIEGEQGYVCHNFVVKNNTANNNLNAGFRFADDENGIVQYNSAKNNSAGNCYKAALTNVTIIDNNGF